MSPAKGYAAQAKDKPLVPFQFSRRDLRPDDVSIDIHFCGVCHSDMHTVHAEWDGSIYANGTLFPCVPGHEIVGRVRAVGEEVSKHRPGDLVAIGTMVDSCHECAACRAGLEQHCLQGATWTYNAPDRISGENTYGGYSNAIVVRESFVLKVSHSLDQLAAVAPLLCAGITMWSPLRHWKAGPGKKVGVVGVGGLGHMGIKLAHALGAHITAFTTSENKRNDALALGADDVVVSRDPVAVKQQAASLDLIIDTVSVQHNLNPYVNLLRQDGTLVLVGIPADEHPSPSVASLLALRRSVAGSLVGGISETQELLEFCAEHNVLADIERIPIQQIETAYRRMVASDVKYRFVLDMSSLA
jgi:uncharacterized zinc-type alcohol dehydrogenase-like protein